MVLENEVLAAGDKILFLNVCEFYGFKLGFTILSRMLLHFSYLFSSTANLLLADMQSGKHLEYNDKTMFASFEFLNCA